MPEKWLQVRGDPSVRNFLFSQQRVESLFDVNLDTLHNIVKELLKKKGVFHAKLHYSSNQLTLWFCDDAYRYRVYVIDEVLSPGFLDQIRDQSVAHLKPLLFKDDVDMILSEFKRLRLSDKTLYMRNGSINLINGMIGMTFSCDGAHYIDYKTFCERLDNFGTTDESKQAMVC
jgi:hypothetical protein